MQPLIKIIENLKNSEIKKIIDSRTKEFSELGKKPINEIFKEMCFCLLTANFSAQGGIKIQKEINNGFLTLSETELAKKLSELGHRFPNARAKYIFLARQKINDLRKILENERDELKVREWLVKNIKGYGYKESAHFLRNIGHRNLAILDRHILKNLVKLKVIDEVPKSLTPKVYFEIEEKFKRFSEEADIPMDELDLLFWSMEAGEVFK